MQQILNLTREKYNTICPINFDLSHFLFYEALYGCSLMLSLPTAKAVKYH